MRARPFVRSFALSHATGRLERAKRVEGQLSQRDVLPLIRSALAEDRASADLTSRSVLPRGLRIRADVIAKTPGILAGVKPAALTFAAVDPSLRCRLKRHSGARVTAGATILTVEGRAASIFAAERTALNFLGHLSGIATLTNRYARAAHPVPVLDTRKTLPLLRALEKCAVRIGGGSNHRSDLSEAILIKTNHLKALRARSSPQSIVRSRQLIQWAIARAKRAKPRTFVEIEVANLHEFKAALQAKPDAILLDNWSISNIRRAVRLRTGTPYTVHRTPILEVSGGVTLANIRVIARTGVDRISIGRLTHSAPALDISLHVR